MTDEGFDADLVKEKTHIEELIGMLERNYISEGCDGSVFSCASCDAVQLRTELWRHLDQIEWLMDIPADERSSAIRNHSK